MKNTNKKAMILGAAALFLATQSYAKVEDEKVSTIMQLGVQPRYMSVNQHVRGKNDYVSKKGYLEMDGKKTEGSYNITWDKTKLLTMVQEIGDLLSVCKNKVPSTLKAGDPKLADYRKILDSAVDKTKVIYQELKEDNTEAAKSDLNALKAIMGDGHDKYRPQDE